MAPADSRQGIGRAGSLHGVDYLAVTAIIMGGIALYCSGFVVYRTRHRWERDWAKRGRGDQVSNFRML